jgi:DNA phosphorothioation-dependent restriction protein DptG
MNTSHKFYLFIFLCIIPLIFSQKQSNEQNKNNNIIIVYLKKLSYIIEGITTKILSKIILDLQLHEPYDFGAFFILGCIIRIAFAIISSFFKQKDNFIYNTPDNAESLYQIIKQLNQLSEKMNKESEVNPFNDNNDDINENNDENCNKINNTINSSISKLEKSIISIENEIKKNQEKNEEILKTIEQCQQEIKDSFTPQ